MTELQNPLPPGWDSQYDPISGKHYFVNHYTKTTSWDDPRNKKTGRASGEYVPLQHNSPEFRRNYVYPSQSPPKQAFQMIPLQDMRPTRSPINLRQAKVQDSSLFVPAPQMQDTDDPVAKIGAMFPTVSDTHIKLLLKKYLNREALVISALQVEKHPITTPGPFATPPPQRVVGPPKSSSPFFGLRNSPRPHSSPKLKLRYMKSIFPNADETIILECLQNNDNSIQKTSETLKEMGYSKKDTVSTPKPEPKKVVVEVTVPPVKTSQDKTQLKETLQKQYPDVPEHLISIALESVNFDEQRANQILQIVKQEDIEPRKSERKEVPPPSNSAQLPISESRQSLKSLLKAEKVEFNRSGHNPQWCKGANEKLLLENYVQWQGANKNLVQGTQGAIGPNKGLVGKKGYVACGPNGDLRKGACGLAKGSIFKVVGETGIRI